MTKREKYFLVYLLGISLIESFTCEENVEVKIKQGLVSGKLEKTFLTGKPYYSFKGIPYAEPPVGELRFKVRTTCFIHLTSFKIQLF